jgi:hypothetical protein
MERIYLIILLGAGLWGAHLPSGVSERTAGAEHTLWDANEISAIHGNRGNYASYLVNGRYGLEWPKGSGKQAVFHAGLWLAAGRVNGVAEIRTAACEYQSEFTPGGIGNGSMSGHLYRLHRAEIDAFLSHDWENPPQRGYRRP